MAGERACPLSSTKAEANQLIQLSLSMPRDLTTGMTTWRFEGTTTAERRRNPFVPPRANFMELFDRRIRRRAALLLWSGWRRSWRGRSRCFRLRARIDPARMDAAVQTIRNLVVDRAAKADETAESGLNVATRTAETIIEVEMTECGIQIISPHQAYHAPSEPDTFWIARRSIDCLGGFHELGGFALAVPGRCCGCFRRVWLLLLRLILGAQIATLGNRGSDSDQKRSTRHRHTTHGHTAESGEKTTHKVPDQLPACPTFISTASARAEVCQKAPVIAPGFVRLMPPKLVPIAADKTMSPHQNPMTDICIFVQ